MEPKDKSWKDICKKCQYNRTHYVHDERTIKEKERYGKTRCHKFVEGSGKKMLERV